MSTSLIISILAGIAVGYFIKMPKGTDKKLGILQAGCLLFMLFFMGVKIGLDNDIMKNLPAIGGKAIILAILSIVGSVLAVMPVSRLLKHLEKRKVKA